MYYAQAPDQLLEVDSNGNTVDGCSTDVRFGATTLAPGRLYGQLWDNYDSSGHLQAFDLPGFAPATLGWVGLNGNNSGGARPAK
jgi:hypothetical protein